MKMTYREHLDYTYCHRTMDGTPFRFTGQETNHHAYIAMPGGRTMFVGRPDPGNIMVYANGKTIENDLSGYDYGSVGGALLFVGEPA